MHNTCITSTISFRTRGLTSVSFNDYSHCSNERHAYAYSSPRACCSCCGNSTYNVPISSGYCYSLYGLRQSSLIQWSPYRKLITNGFDRSYYCRLPVCDVDRSCNCDKVYNLREKSMGGRKGGFRKCMVFEERSERRDFGTVDEAEVLLSILTDDIDEECFRVAKETQRLVKKPVVEKRENGGSKKKRSDLRRDYESVVSSRKKDNRREEIVRREEVKDDLLKNRMRREKDEREALLRKKSQKEEERESVLNKENWKVNSRLEDEEDFLRREERRQKVRKDGSSCSSYYSFSSTGDYGSDNEDELTEGKFVGESSSGPQKNLRISEIDYTDSREEGQRRAHYRENNGDSLSKKTTEKEIIAGSSIIESNFRKKSEKKLVDISVEEESKLTRESNSKKSSEYYVEYDDRKVKSTGSMKVDETKMQQLRQTGDEVSKQSETRLKYKQFAEKKDTNLDDLRDSYGSQKVHSGKGEMSAKVASSRQTTSGHSTREDEYGSNSRKVAEVSEIQEFDLRKTSISRQRIEASVKEEDYSTSILNSANDAVKQQQQYDQASGIVESREKSQKWRKEDDRNKTKLETLVRPPSPLPEKGMPPLGSTVGISTDQVVVGSSQIGSPASHGHNIEYSYGGVEGNSSHGHEDAIESAAQLEKSSAHYVGEFVDQVRSKILRSEIEREERTNETEVIMHEEQHDQKKLAQHSSGDSHSTEHDSRPSDMQSGAKGPSDEMWKVDEPPADVRENKSKAGSAIVKRSGRSLWSVISDVVRLRWSPHSESHSSSRKTGEKSSPNQSTSSETWFSGYEAENEEAPDETKGRSTQSGGNEEEKVPSRVEEGSSSSVLEGHLKPVDINTSPSSVVLKRDSPTSSISLPSGGETSKGTSSAAVVDSKPPLPALRMQRSPAVRGDLEAGKASSSDTGPSEQLNTGSIEQPESAVKTGELKRRKLERKDQIVKDRFDELEEAYRLEAEQRKVDENFMREALLEAQKAADNWEVPVGAVLVHNGKIIARGCNLVEELRDSTAHAEMICIREASNVLRSWRLSDTTLYVTLEPCPMCAGAILQARVDTVVWGAPNKLLGADGSWIRLFPSGDGGNGLEQTDKPAAPIHPFHPKIIIRRGVLSTECADAMQQFFKLRRKKKDKAESDASSSTPAPPPPCLPISNRPSKLLAKMHDTFSLMFCL